VLQRFLEFVETRGRASVQKIGGEADSDFEIEVAERLRAAGYEVDLQIGVSGYRIDLGVRHPGHPEHFLAGIECDGAAYHSSKSARDRDRIRQQVLEGLGWHLVRVWSTDWFDDPERQTRRLVAELEHLAARPPEVSGDYIILASAQSVEEAATADSEPLSSTAQEDGDIAAVPALAGESQGRAALPSVAAVPLELRPQPVLEAQTHSAQLDATSPLTEPELVALLRHYRDAVIAPATAGWQSQRSILRDSMIETLVHQNITDPDDWFNKVPTYLRQGTDPTEKRLHLDRICDLVARCKKRN
jgi:very-short-patch-repair endonuclease